MADGDGHATRRRDERAWLDALPTPLLQQAATSYIALGSAANIIMQLSWPGVGYGVKDSTVHEAALFSNPARRRRTTIGFLAVAVFGSSEERAAYRRATNASHARVRSPEGAEPAYNAFDPELQRWVAACLFIGFEQAYEAVFGPLGERRDVFYREGVVLGGMLQMPVAMWPTDRDAFEIYWREGLAAARIDAPVRAYLTRVMRMEYLPKPASVLLAPLRTLVTAGSLPPELRTLMHLDWSEAKQRRFDRLAARLARRIRRQSPQKRARMFTDALDDVRARMAQGLPLFH